MHPAISIIIVNYNTADHLIRCIPSVLAQKGPSFEIIVVDNASSDNSIDLIKSKFPSVTLIDSSENLGFAKANNLALRKAKGEYIFFLNPDTEVRPNALVTMIKFMKTHPQIGIAGTALFFPSGTPQSSVKYKYPGQRYTHGELDGLPGDIAWFLGASIIGRANLLKKVKGFSEEYFLYGEDLDLGLTIRKEGWELGYIPEAHIIHWEGQSERQSLPIDVWRKKFVAEIIFYQRHYSPETINRIKRNNYLHALWRIATLSTFQIFSTNKTKTQEKLARYKLALQFYR